MSVDGVQALLRQHGAEGIEHPGGTLYAHLLRVHDRLCKLGFGFHVQLAGLAHAVYGTDGFPVPLLAITERLRLRELIGDEGEMLVYRYGACDRKRTWAQLVETRQVWDRFNDQVEQLTVAELRPFIDLTIVNEVDVIEQTPAVVEHVEYFRQLFRAWAPLASERVMIEARRVLSF